MCEAPSQEDETELMQEEDSESESSYDSEDDDSSFDMEGEAQRFLSALREGTLAANAPPQKTPQEKWDDFVLGVETNTNASIKVTDELVAWVAKENTARIDKLCTDLIRASQKAFVIMHVILGRAFLALLSSQQQEQLFKAIVAKHAKTVTFWKLGSDDSTEACGIPTTSLLQAMSKAEWAHLTELEIRGLELTTVQEVELALSFLKQAPKIRQFNLLGMVMNEALVNTEGLLDPIVAHVETIAGFDELQLCRSVQSTPTTKSSSPPLISPVALEHLFSVKVKWWRLALDGMALTNRHIDIIGAALKASDACKMNDVLSLQHNPLVTNWEALYKICLYKQRMGLVLSDDPQWVATFDLVRPLNNLHRRLEYLKPDGSYKSKEAWIDYLAVLGNLPWIGEARTVNYLWFALLEAPKLIYED